VKDRNRQEKKAEIERKLKAELASTQKDWYMAQINALSFWRDRRQSPNYLQETSIKPLIDGTIFHNSAQHNKKIASRSTSK
jgi:hypothetical protein